MKRQTILIVVLIVAALGLVTFFIFKNLKPFQSPSLNTETTSPNNENSTSIANTNNNQPLASVPKMPDFSKIAISSSIAPADRNKLIAEIRDTITAIKQSPDYVQEWLQLGILRKAAGDYEGAAEIWKYVTLIRPDDYIAFNNLGDLYKYYLKNYSQAEKYWLRSVALKTDFVQGYQELSDLYRYNLKKPDSAVSILIEGINKNPKITDLPMYLATYYQDMGDKINAKKYFEKVLTIDPNNQAAKDGIKSL